MALHLAGQLTSSTVVISKEKSFVEETETLRNVGGDPLKKGSATITHLRAKLHDIECSILHEK
jgi:hypothetical protein